MSDVAESGEAGAAPKKKSKAILIALILAIVLGGGAFYGVYSGLVPLPFGEKEGAAPEMAAEGEDVVPFAEADRAAPIEEVAFIALDDMIVSLGPEARSSHLKVRLSIEVDATAEPSVLQVKPRIMDVLNTFLRAVDEREFEMPSSMMRLRAQMLRRVQLVTPENAVRDLLIQEFVLN